MTEKLAAEQIREMVARVTPPGAPATPIPVISVRSAEGTGR
jgi:hypothetical protein